MARLKLKLQLYCGDEIAMGPGKADLLEAIAREGSISGAGRAMGMSYRRAWLLVDVMNRCFREPLVAARPGGGKNAGAQLTPAASQTSTRCPSRKPSASQLDEMSGSTARTRRRQNGATVQSWSVVLTSTDTWPSK